MRPHNRRQFSKNVHLYSIDEIFLSLGLPNLAAIGKAFAVPEICPIEGVPMNLGYGNRVGRFLLIV